MTNTLIVFTASILIWIMFAGVILLWVVDGRIKKEVALHALFACTFAYAFSEMIKSLFPTVRPFVANGLSAIVLWKPGDGAFPSGHAAAAFAMAVTVWLHNKKWGFVYIILAILIGAARIIGNVHFPIDVIAGAVIGIATALVTEKLHLFKLIA